MSLRLVNDEGFAEPTQIVNPLQLFQENVRLTREQLDAAFDDLSAKYKGAADTLNEAFHQARATLNVLENNVVIVAFRTGHLEFSGPPEPPPT